MDIVTHSGDAITTQAGDHISSVSPTDITIVVPSAIPPIPTAGGGVPGESPVDASGVGTSAVPDSGSVVIPPITEPKIDPKTVSGWPALTAVKLYLGVTTNTDDAYISSIMAASINIIEKYLDRKLEYKEETETVLLTNCDKVSHLYRRIYLHRWPVTSVKSATNELGRSIDFQIDEEGLLCGEFHSGYKISITYTGGLNPIPFDIISVFYEMINSLYAQKGTVASTAGDLKSESVPGVYARSYYQSGSGDNGLSKVGLGVINPMNYAFVLDPYKAWYC